jgi:hypothetical protein
MEQKFGFMLAFLKNKVWILILVMKINPSLSSIFINPNQKWQLLSN